MAASQLSRHARRRFASFVRFFVESLEKRTFLDGGSGVFSPDVVIPNEGESYTLYAAETPEDAAVTIDWGDGSTPDSFATTGSNMWRSHIYADNGTYPVFVTLETIFSTTEDYFDAVIANEAPYATPSRSFSDTTGLFTVGLSNIIDVSADASSVRYSFSDNFDSLAQSYGAASTTASAQIDFVGGGEISSQEIYCRVWDKDDGYRDYTTVLNVADLGVATASATQTNLTWTDSVTGETGWRVQRSTDGTNFSIYENLPANTTHFEDTAATEGTRYWYRVRAYGTQGTSNDIGYSPKKATTTKLAAPTDILANISETTGDLQVSWTNQSAHQEDIILTWVQQLAGGGLGIAPSDSVTLPGDAQDYTFTNTLLDVGYSVVMQVVNDAGNASANTTAEKSLVEPANDWTTVYNKDATPRPSPSYVNFEWSPGDTQPNGNETISIPRVTGYGNEEATLTITGLPRHTWAQIQIQATSTGNAENGYISGTVDNTISMGGDTGPTTFYLGISDQSAPNADAFQHTSSSMTLTLEGENFDFGSKWYPSLIHVRMYLPHVSLSASGQVIEDKFGTDRLTFAAHRNTTFSNAIKAMSLKVNLKDNGGSASPDSDYTKIDSITIPAQVLSESKVLEPIDDDVIESRFEIAKLKIIPDKTYALAAQGVAAEGQIRDEDWEIKTFAADFGSQTILYDSGPDQAQGGVDRYQGRKWVDERTDDTPEDVGIDHKSDLAVRPKGENGDRRSGIYGYPLSVARSMTNDFGDYAGTPDFGIKGNPVEGVWTITGSAALSASASAGEPVTITLANIAPEGQLTHFSAPILFEGLIPKTIENDTLQSAWGLVSPQNKSKAYGGVKNHMYVTGAATTQGAFETVLEVGCGGAAGLRPRNPNEAEGAAISADRSVVDEIWGEFSDRSVLRVDGKIMKYNHDLPALPNDPGAGRHASEMLNDESGRGECSAWAELLGMTFWAQAIHGDYLIAEGDAFTVQPAPAQGSIGNYVHGTTHADNFRYHVLLAVDAYPDRIYDPSYGTVVNAAADDSAEVVWEDVNLVDVRDNATWTAQVVGFLDLSWLVFDRF